MAELKFYDNNNLAVRTFEDGSFIKFEKYKEYFYVHSETDELVRMALAWAYNKNFRVRLHYGETGVETRQRLAQTPPVVGRSVRQVRGLVEPTQGASSAEPKPIGTDWMEENDVEGRVSVSCGPLRIPLLIYNQRSIGGGSILDHCIVRIHYTAEPYSDLYRHPNYIWPNVTVRHIEAGSPDQDLFDLGYRYTALVDGEMHANFKTYAAAMRFLGKWGPRDGRGRLETQRAL